MAGIGITRLHDAGRVVISLRSIFGINMENEKFKTVTGIYIRILEQQYAIARHAMEDGVAEDIDDVMDMLKKLVDEDFDTMVAVWS